MTKFFPASKAPAFLPAGRPTAEMREAYKAQGGRFLDIVEVQIIDATPLVDGEPARIRATIEAADGETLVSAMNTLTAQGIDPRPIFIYRNGTDSF